MTKTKSSVKVRANQFHIKVGTKLSSDPYTYQMSFSKMHPPDKGK